MHKSSYLRMEYLIRYYEPYIIKNKEKANVLDIGSYNINGTYKDLLPDEKYNYTGLDMAMGPNVDIVPEDIYNWKEIESESMDLVISGQAFEHIEYPWLTIKEIERILKPSGFCIITAPNAGTEHKAPLDCYRYFPDGLRALASWGGLKVHCVATAGVPEINGTEDWINNWNDSFLVAQKEPSVEKIDDPFKFERRVYPHGNVIDTYKTLEIAVSESSKRFNNDKRFILFGAGEIGGEAIKILGDDKVYCFADNSENKIGSAYLNKKVISIKELTSIKDQYNCLITASPRISREIKLLLDKNNVKNESLYLESAEIKERREHSDLIWGRTES